MQTATVSAAPDDRIEAFGAAIDRIRERVEAEIGAEDLAYLKKVDRFSRAMEIAGRLLIHVSVEPVGFGAGVVALWLHKQLQATEVGHTVLHGTFDKIDGADAYRSKSFRWQTPIDEESWRQTHNIRHHGFTNIAGRDPDIHFGPIRWTEHTPYHPRHRGQLRKALLLMAHFGIGINLQYTGLADFLEPEGQGDFTGDRSLATFRASLRRAMRKFVPYYGRELVLFPALAGPFWWKVLLGNWLTELMRDAYSAATIYCGHVGEDVADYPAGTRAGSRARWYVMQVEATNDFEVPLPMSILCGALDRQIEHHLFPRFPTNRLREVAPEVRAACEAHGVRYHTDSWPGTLRKVVRRLRQLSRPTAREAVQRIRAAA